MLGVIEQLDDIKTKHQACQLIRRSLNKTIQRIQDSISSVEVTEQKDTVDILKAKVVKARKLLNDSQQAEDGDLAVQSLEFEETITNLPRKHYTVKASRSTSFHPRSWERQLGDHTQSD